MPRTGRESNRALVGDISPLQKSVLGDAGSSVSRRVGRLALYNPVLNNQ
jgi:hypothetical protein